MKTVDDPALRFALECGLLDPRHLQAATSACGPSPAAVRSALIERGQLDERRLTETLAESFGFATVDLSTLRPDRELREALPPSFVLRHRVVPLDRTAASLRVAVADPFDLELLDHLPHLAGSPVTVVLATPGDIRRAIAANFTPEAAGAITPDSLATVSAADAENVAENADDAPVIRLVHSIVRDAVQQRASDIHLEPLAHRFRVRYRVDGSLLEVEAPPKRLQPPVISRVKIMADISIAEKRVPQDGRCQVRIDDRQIDLRVATLPTVHGESIVMRLLDRAALPPGLAELGLLDDDRHAIERLLAPPDGMVLVTGPTGSGKTTTLYAALNHLNRADRKIVTVEDPIEYQLAGVNQVPVNATTGMTFAGALRAMLRQAPDIVMVGEVRDRETAEIAINASLTGHLVFSTLHTNDAPGALTRLLDIGVKPFLIAASLRAVIAQRLVRRVCAHCAQPVRPVSRELRHLDIGPTEAATAAFRRGAGCPACLGTGYRGRLGLFEILVIDDEIRRLVHERADVARLRAAAGRAGLRRLVHDGRRKVLAGLTTIDEVIAATAGDPGQTSTPTFPP